MLYILATPIGNIEDITLRALRILKEVDLILAEDTREAKKLLDLHSISNKVVMRYDSFSTFKLNQDILKLLKEGKNIALVSDAGTPSISDPGAYLVKMVREEDPSIKISPIPGVSALTAALSVSGFFGNSFSFWGFVPHKKGRETFFKDLSLDKNIIIFYESTHRLLKTLESLEKFCPERRFLVAKELTKVFENSFLNKPKELIEIFNRDPKLSKGEFVIVAENQK